MSDHSHAPSAPKPEKFDIKDAGQLPKLFLGLGVAGILGSLLAFFVGKDQFAFSWLFGFTVCFTLCVGTLFWTCLHHATDADWSVVVRRVLENLACLMPWLALAFAPILIFWCVPTLWNWWNIDPAHDVLLHAKSGFLNHGFFLFRMVAYFAILSWVALSLRARSVAQDSDGAARHSLVMRKFGVGGIPAVAICLTFAAVDWLMAIDYKWFSTMWGVYIFAGAVGSSMSLLVLIITGLKRAGYLSVVNKEHYHIMGKFMLAFTVFWAYIGYSQYMLIWYANIPEETIYFRIRNTESWWYFSQFLVIGRFFLPFPILLFQFTKKTNLINWVAAWVIGMQLLDIFVIVLPGLHPTGVHFSDLFFGACSVIGIAGILGWVFLNSLGKTNLFPTRDPRLAASLKISN
jgi:hypothetical protein